MSAAQASPAHRDGPSSWNVRLLIALLCAVWGSTWIVIKWGLRDLPPLTSGAARFLVAAAVMSALAPFLHRREGGDRPPLALSLLVGATNFGASYGIVYWSETRLPSGVVAVLWSIFPIFMAVASHWFLPDVTLAPRQWLGFFAGFAGVATLFATDLYRFGSSGLSAALILLLSPLAFAVGTTVLKRRGERLSSVLVNREGMWFGAALLAAGAVLFERDEPVRWTLRASISVLYLAVMGTVVTFGIYFWLLRRTAAHRLSLISYITPAIALILGRALEGEPITAHLLLGSALILAGVAAVVRPRQAPAAA